MTEAPLPGEATEAELDATDRALDALGRREAYSFDPALHALDQLARHIDSRAARTADSAVAVPRPRRAAAPELNGRQRPGVPGRGGRPAMARRARKPLRLLAVPLMATALLTFGVATAASTTPEAPLYSLHQILFPPATPPADSVRLHLAGAEQALDNARNATGHARATAIAQAREHLDQARKLLPAVSDSQDRARLHTQLSTLDHQAQQLSDNDGDGQDRGGQRHTDDQGSKNGGEQGNSGDGDHP
jgi:hypothetical protein